MEEGGAVQQTVARCAGTSRAASPRRSPPLPPTGAARAAAAAPMLRSQCHQPAFACATAPWSSPGETRGEGYRWRSAGASCGRCASLRSAFHRWVWPPSPGCAAGCFNAEAWRQPSARNEAVMAQGKEFTWGFRVQLGRGRSGHALCAEEPKNSKVKPSIPTCEFEFAGSSGGCTSSPELQGGSSEGGSRRAASIASSIRRFRGSESAS